MRKKNNMINSELIKANWIELRNVINESKVKVPATPEDIAYAVNKLINELKWFTVKELAIETNKSVSTIRRYLKQSIKLKHPLI